MMEAYVRKKTGHLNMLVHERLALSGDAEVLGRRIAEFFAASAEGGLIKQTSFKKIFKADFCGRSVLVKVYKNTTMPKRIKSLIRPAGAFSEFAVASRILEHGILTPLPLVVGQRKRMGLECESVIVTDFLEGSRDLRDLLFQNRFSSPAEKRLLFFDFGRLTRKIFDSRIYQEDYSVNNFMVRKEKGVNRIYLIDFEKARIDTDIPERKTVWLLAKLNRLGRVVRLTDRIRFLKGYLEATAGRREFKRLAAKIRAETAAVLKRDFRHGRRTSPYTCNDYMPFRKGTVRGLFLNVYAEADIEKLAKDIKARPQNFSVSLKANESERALTVLKLDGKKQADRVWVLVSNLIIAGLAAHLPELFLQGVDAGLVAFEPSAYAQLMQTIKLEKGENGFLSDNFTKELDLLNRLLAPERPVQVSSLKELK